MKEFSVGGQRYRLPNGLSRFQRELYLHLIDWKWQNITEDPGCARGYPYDAILPESYAKEKKWPHIYPEIRETLKAHQRKNKFRIHQHFYHMASSQAANINLFLAILHHPAAHTILSAIKPDFASLASDHLDNGYCIEFWGGNFDRIDVSPGNKGLLGDKSSMAGTDSDIAIAYRNLKGETCLWLIEHKLTEKAFTGCGGFKSRGRRETHVCSRAFTEILKNKQSCYYHNVRKFNYWELTDTNQMFFANHAAHESCPFRGRINQLWRNQLLALSIEQDKRQPYDNVYFSVVRHPGNLHLEKSLEAYKGLIAYNPKFSVFTSADVIRAAAQMDDVILENWINWYTGLYKL